MSEKMGRVRETPEKYRAYMRDYMRWYRSDAQVLLREQAYLRECARILQARGVRARAVNKKARLVDGN